MSGPTVPVQERDALLDENRNLRVALDVARRRVRELEEQLVNHNPTDVRRGFERGGRPT